jgi:hypothetical protein
MSYLEYQQEFEADAEKWSQKYNQMSEDEILHLIKTGKWDRTYQIWFSIRTKALLERSAPILLKVLKRWFTSFLHRNHCADALFHIANISDDNLKIRVIGPLSRFQPSIDRIKAINELEKIIDAKTKLKE